MKPTPAFSDCCEIVMRPEMYCVPTRFPSIVISVVGYWNTPAPKVAADSGKVRPGGGVCVEKILVGSNMSAQVKVFAGNCRVVLQGMVMVTPLTTAVPPHWLAGIKTRGVEHQHVFDEDAKPNVKVLILVWLFEEFFGSYLP